MACLLASFLETRCARAGRVNPKQTPNGENVGVNRTWSRTIEQESGRITINIYNSLKQNCILTFI